LLFIYILSYGTSSTNEEKYKVYVQKIHSLRNVKTSNESKLNAASTKYYKTYHLSLLIQSESDEGIYQCLNPNYPKSIHSNTTVILASEQFQIPS
jgi:hypothetical protein